MRHLLPSTTSDNSRNLLLIKVSVFGLFVLLLWPFPAMVAHRSPGGEVLGQYTLKYSVLLAAYGLILVIWAIVSIWSLLTLDSKRFTSLRRRLVTYFKPMARIGGAVIFLLFLIRILILIRVISFPNEFVTAMRVVPTSALCLVVIVIFSMFDDAVLMTAETTLHAWLSHTGLMRIKLSVPLWSIIGGTSLIAGLTYLGVQQFFWDYPLTYDASAHLYLGQHLLRGGIPYVTHYGYPPFRYIVSLVWNLGARLSHTQPVIFVRGLDILVSAGVLIVVYQISKRLSGSQVGGMIGAIALLGTEHLQELLVYGPTFRLTTVLFVMLSVWMAQRKSWLWAGIFASVATLIYQPAASVGLVVLITLVVSTPNERLKSLFQLFVGVIIIVAPVSLWLLSEGVLEDAIAQSFVAIATSLVGGASATPDAASASSALPPSLSWYWTVMTWALRGDLDIVLVVLIGLITLVTQRNALRTFMSENILPVALTTVLWLILAFVNFDGSLRDTIMIIAPAVPFAGLIVQFPSRLLPILEDPLESLRRVGAVAVIVALSIIGMADNPEHYRFLLSQVTIPLSQQIALVDEMEQLLTEQDSVLVLGDYWYLTLSGRDSIIPLRFESYFDRESNYLDISYDDLLDTIEADKPVVIFRSVAGKDTSDWRVTSEYINVGLISPDTRGFEQELYVIYNRPDLLKLVSQWPLQSARKSQ